MCYREQEVAALSPFPSSQAAKAHWEPPDWYAIYTRSRHEGVVERYLNRYDDLQTYLPTKMAWSSRKDRRQLIEVPALPGYLFIACNLTPMLRAEVKKAPGVVTIISSDGQPSRIPPSQIKSLRILLDSHQDVVIHKEWSHGQRVLIQKGPLKGATGVLVRTQDNKHRLLVAIEYVGLAVSIDIHESDVELL